MNNNHLDDKILAAIAAGHGTRDKLMEIRELRLSTWSVVGERLNTLTKRGALIASKAGWRLSQISKPSSGN